MKAKLVRFFKQIGLYMSLFDYVKCIDCKWHGTGAEVYCKPPLGECTFENKERKC